MNPTSYTYGGITVEFNETQKALLQADEQAINKLNLDIIEWDRQISVHQSTINYYENQLSSYCPTLAKYEDRKSCAENATFARNTGYSDRATVMTQKQYTLEQLARAKQKLNDDLILIQNQIKFQIQSQIANTTANTQGASNTVAINQSNPAVIAEQIRRQAEQDKLKQEQNIKIVGFILLTVVVLTIGVISIRKIFS